MIITSNLHSNYYRFIMVMNLMVNGSQFVYLSIDLEKTYQINA